MMRRSRPRRPSPARTPTTQRFATSSAFAGKEADDAAISGTAAGDDESSNPPTQRGQFGGR